MCDRKYPHDENHKNMFICTYEKPMTYLSSTYARPPDIPAAKFRPIRPRITARPPVMYSHP